MPPECIVTSHLVVLRALECVSRPTFPHPPLPPSWYCVLILPWHVLNMFSGCFQKHSFCIWCFLSIPELRLQVRSCMVPGRKVRFSWSSGNPLCYDCLYEQSLVATPAADPLLSVISNRFYYKSTQIVPLWDLIDKRILQEDGIVNKLAGIQFCKKSTTENECLDILFHNFICFHTEVSLSPCICTKAFMYTLIFITTIL